MSQVLTEFSSLDLGGVFTAVADPFWCMCPFLAVPFVWTVFLFVVILLVSSFGRMMK